MTIPLKAADLAYWDTASKSYVVEPEQVRLQVGSSSGDIRMEKTIEVK